MYIGIVEDVITEGTEIVKIVSSKGKEPSVLKFAISCISDRSADALILMSDFRDAACHHGCQQYQDENPSLLYFHESTNGNQGCSLSEWINL